MPGIHTDFVHLHVHTTYSFLDAAVDIDKLVARAKALDMKALAITDHGNIHGALEFYDAAQKAGIKPIIGCEFYVTPHDRAVREKQDGEDNYFHLICLAYNQEGYDNLMKLCSTAYLDGFYYKPRIDKKILAECSGGLIGSSACIIGEIPRTILRGDTAKAEYITLEHKEIFGEDNFFLELMDHGIPEERLANEKLIELSKKTNTPLIATNDIHYIYREDAEAQDVYLCIGTGKKLADENRLKFSGTDFYLKSSEEMLKSFEKIPDALRNTVYIADRISFDKKQKYGNNEAHLPKYTVPEIHTEDSYLAELCHAGLKKRYTDINEEILNRLEYELGVIKKMKYSGYFLIVQDFINWARQNDIWVGPGRGSAAGSLVAFTLGITDIDPLKYDLIFERFLNPDRVSMPDIDTDFEDEGRERVIEYVRQKYGEDKVSQIITFGTLKSRMVIRDVCRVLDISITDADKTAKLIPQDLKITLEKAWKESAELRQWIQSRPDLIRMYEISKKLEGLRRNPGIHAAGIIIGDDELTRYVPLYRDPKRGGVATQYEGPLLEECGLLKMDFLGLKNLSVIKRSVKLIKDIHGIDLKVDSLPFDDEATYKTLQEGKSVGVFQLESEGMRELMKSLKPDNFEEIIALIALYRPGPLNSGMDKTFIRRKFKKEAVRYPHKNLEPVLNTTFGVFIYQEQVMKIAQIIGGFSMAKADELRKAMGKKDTAKMSKLKNLFMEGAVKNHYDEAMADKLYDDMAEFAEYGFNKSHSAAYAVITFMTAYLKTHYTVEYMCALMTVYKGSIDDIAKYLKEAKEMGIEVLQPDVNYSQVDFSVEKNKIRFGLSAIQNVGELSALNIIDERTKNGKYAHFFDFIDRVDLFQCNKKVLESLVKGGAFDSMGASRSSLFCTIESAIAEAASIKKQKLSGQMDLFGSGNSGGSNSFLDTRTLMNLQEWHESEKLKFEKEVLGIYISNHPLVKYEDHVKILSTHNSLMIKDAKDNDVVKIAGILTEVSKKTSSKTGKRYARLILEDFEGSIEAMMFNAAFAACEPLLKTDAAVLLEGNVKVEASEKRMIFASNIRLLNDTNLPKIRRILHIHLNDDEIREDRLHNLCNILSAHRGKTIVYVHAHDENYTPKIYKLSDVYNVTVNKDLKRRLTEQTCVQSFYEEEFEEAS